MTARAALYLHATTPLHVGTGQSLDMIDLPIQRERGSGLPVVGGSSVKGVLRAEAESRGPQAFVNSAFGNEQDPNEGAGAVTFGDARLLLFPVRSVRLLFAWVTCPYVLRRYLSDRAELSGRNGGPAPAPVEKAALDAVAIHRNRVLCSGESLLVDARPKDGVPGGTVYLEDADLDAVVAPAVTALAEALADRCLAPELRPLLHERLVIVDDSLFGTFVRQCTEITARVKLDDDKKTVVKGGLWYEEALPAEAILHAGVAAEKTRGKRASRFDPDDHLKKLREIRSAQFGGKASVGRGLCRLAWEVAP
jgi:CRISPR-associated protein Cmr4